MRFSERWLREWVDPDLSTSTLVDRLTMAGLEVDSVQPAGTLDDLIVVAAITEVQPHPQAGELAVCRVETGRGDPVSVVCGAPDVRPGLRTALAQPGARLADGRRVRAAEIRGVPSAGVLCSPAELGLEDDTSGLLVLAPDAPVGEPVARVLALDDTVIELDLTPNRGDCLSIVGLAREVAALTASPLEAPAMDPVAAAVDTQRPVRLSDPAACGHYAGRVMEDVDVTVPTPIWLRERLRRSGIRSLGPVIDVTNYVMLELGQPMHAFDLMRLTGGIEVRNAKAGETLTLLDGQVLELDPDFLVIADDSGPVALAGIMGGEATAVGPGTRHIFLESAFFDPTVVAGRARRLGLHTESAHRFERGVDPTHQQRAVERATALLQTITGGRPGPVVVAGEPRPGGIPIALRPERMRRVLGMALDPVEAEGILRRLGMDVDRTDDFWRIAPPSHRFDLERDVDVIEELARVHGYGALPSHRPRIKQAIHPQSESRVSAATLRTTLVERGYFEAVTYSFVDGVLQQRLDPDSRPVPLDNPLSSSMDVMRTTLWPGLLTALMHNRNRQQDRVRLFECGRRYWMQDGEIKEEYCLAGVAAGTALPEQWSGDSKIVDLFDIKGDVEALLALTGQRRVFAFESDSRAALHPGQSARITSGSETVGWLGTLHPAVARELDVGEGVLLFELRLAPLQTATLPKFSELSRFPSIRRDLAIVVDEDVPADVAQKVIRRAAGDLLRELRLFDVYRGKGIETGRKSYALGLILQHSSRTLTDEDVQTVVDRVIEQLRRDLGATLRE